MQDISLQSSSAAATCSLQSSSATTTYSLNFHTSGLTDTASAASTPTSRDTFFRTDPSADSNAVRDNFFCTDPQADSGAGSRETILCTDPHAIRGTTRPDTELTAEESTQRDPLFRTDWPADLATSRHVTSSFKSLPASTAVWREGHSNTADPDSEGPERSQLASTAEESDSGLVFATVVRVRDTTEDDRGDEDQRQDDQNPRQNDHLPEEGKVHGSIVVHTDSFFGRDLSRLKIPLSNHRNVVRPRNVKKRSRKLWQQYMYCTVHSPAVTWIVILAFVTRKLWYMKPI